MEEYRIERAKKEDLRKLLELYREIVPIEQKFASIEKKIDRVIEKKENIILIAKNNYNEIVGTLTGIICDSIAFGSYDFMVLEYLVVKKEYRHHGIATLLFEEIEKIARENNCGYIILVSSKKNTISHQLYHKMDYNDLVKGFRRLLLEDEC